MKLVMDKFKLKIIAEAGRRLWPEAESWAKEGGRDVEMWKMKNDWDFESTSCLESAYNFHSRVYGKRIEFILYETVNILIKVEFGVKSCLWFQNEQESDFKSPAWSQTKIAVHLIHLPIL